MDRAVSLEARQLQLAARRPFDVGRSRIEPAAHEAVVGGKTIRLQPQVMKVLVALHDKKGEVVTREELIDRCWNGRVVGEDVINRCIWLLRRLAAEGASFGIETVNRGGYRLVEVADQLPQRRYRFAAFALIGSAALVGAVMLLNGLGAQDDHQTLSVSISRFKSDSSSSAAAREATTAASHMLSQGGVVVTPTDDTKGSAGLLILGAFSPSGDGAKAEIQIEDPRRHAILFSHEFVSSAPGGRDLPARSGPISPPACHGPRPS
jgi:DNA-binding winged-HTH domains